MVSGAPEESPSCLQLCVLPEGLTSTENLWQEISFPNRREAQKGVRFEEKSESSSTGSHGAAGSAVNTPCEGRHRALCPQLRGFKQRRTRVPVAPALPSHQGRVGWRDWRSH